MALYTIADLHLSAGVQKPMDIFGGKWQGYMEKIQKNWRAVIQPEDTVVIGGDISWGINLQQSLPDFRILSDLPGKKIIGKGNHDLWWCTVKKMKRFFEENQIKNIDFLFNNCFIYDNIGICGTRGWFYEEEKHGTHDEKVFLRELSRLETSLRAAGEHEKLCFLHYPPRYRGYECPEILELLTRYPVRRCYYGHLHADSCRLAVQDIWQGIEFRLVSADYVNFNPAKILD